MKRFTAKDGFYPVDLVEYGIDHLASAKILFEANPRCYDSAGYLAQLGIELILKALCLYDADEFTDEHKLTSLHSRKYLPKLFPVLHEDSIRLLSRLDNYYQLRYPRMADPVSIGSEEWTNIETVFAELYDRIPVEIKQEYDNRSSNKKGGRFLMYKKIDGSA